jgi:hypothetical protein
MRRSPLWLLLFRLAVLGCSGCAWLDAFVDTDLDLRQERGFEDPDREAAAIGFVDEAGCITSVAGHASALLWDPDTAFENRFGTELVADLDGDGQLERRWYLTQDCNAHGFCSSLLYLSNGGCTALAGPIDGELRVLPTRTEGRADLWTWWGAGCLGREGSAQVLRYRDGRYRSEDFAYCGCQGPRPALCERQESVSGSALSAAVPPRPRASERR